VGKPGGRHLRWQQPHYVVAWLVERTSPCDARSEDELITHWMKFINTWAVMQMPGRKPLKTAMGSRDHERVKALLRRPKHRRL